MPFNYVKSLVGNADPLFQFQMGASATIKKGDLLEFVNGKLVRVNADTDTAPFVADEDKTSDATTITMITVRSTQAGMALFDIGITPIVDGLVCKTNTDKKTVLLDLTDGSPGDLIGGVVYIASMNQQRIITANTYSSNVVTITVAEDFPSAPTTTHKGSIWAAGVGFACKLHASTMYNTLTNVRANRTGGKAVVHEVDLKNKKVMAAIIP